MAQRDNMPESTDSIVEGASGSSTTSPFGSDVGATGTGYAGGTTGDYAAGGLGTTGDAIGATSGADLGTSYGASTTTSSTTGSSLNTSLQGIRGQATDKAREVAVQGKDRATDALGSVSQLVNDAARMADERLGAGTGDIARRAATAIDGFTDSLRGKDVDDLLDDARGFIRKSPGVAIGVAAGVGFLLVRLLKAGTPATGTTGTTGYAANDGATPPYVEGRGDLA